MPCHCKSNAWNRPRRLSGVSAFSIIEVLFAVAILATGMLGTYALISGGSREAVRSENSQEMAGLLLSAKTCVQSFGFDTLRGYVGMGETPLWFGTGGTECLTGSSHPIGERPASAPTIALKNYSGDGPLSETETSLRQYAVDFATGTWTLGDDAVRTRVVVGDGTSSQSLEFVTYR